MSTLIVLDASAVIAFLQGEPGDTLVSAALESGNCAVTAANQTEIIAKSLDRGMNEADIRAVLAALGYSVLDITAADGMQAGWMRAATRSAGLSLGDRLCLAVAQRLKAKVLTVDRPWINLAPLLGLDIQCIRPDSH